MVTIQIRHIYRDDGMLIVACHACTVTTPPLVHVNMIDARDRHTTHTVPRVSHNTRI